MHSALSRHIACLLFCCAILTLIRQAPAQERSIVGPATDDEIQLLIRDLGDPAFSKRTFATRRLCSIGSAALGALRGAANGEDAETSLRARKLLSTLSQVWFSGVEIRLDADKKRFEWNEPMALSVILTNRSAYESRIPMQSIDGDRNEGSTDAHQVAMMLDVSDWLRVQDANGREIELRVNDIADDPDVLSVVHERVDAGPSSVVPAGESVTLTAQDFNRGWARYPLLDAGEYTIVMNYAPEWLDPVLAANQVGRVSSNVLRVHVTRGAPEHVSRGGAEAEIEVRRDGDALVSALTNRTDQTLRVNLNFGSTAPFADGRWVLEREGQRTEIPGVSGAGRSWTDFSETKLVVVEPGASVELARIEIDRLRDSMIKAGAKAPLNEGAVTFVYSNLCDRQWQAREESHLAQDDNAPAVLKKPLPARILSTRLNSQPFSPWAIP